MQALPIWITVLVTPKKESKLYKSNCTIVHGGKHDLGKDFDKNAILLKKICGYNFGYNLKDFQYNQINVSMILNIIVKN